MGAAPLDVLAFTSVWVASAAGMLCAAASSAMEVPLQAVAVGLAVSGTIVVYNLDRLRDLERDFATSPLRSAFIERNRGMVTGLTGIAAVAAAGFAFAAGPRALLVLAPALALGLLHRRLKRIPLAKPLYISLAWALVVVGLPAALATGAEHVAAVALVLGPSLAANVIASSLRDGEVDTRFVSRSSALSGARTLAVLALVAALLAPQSVRALAAVPGLTFLALLRSELSERYGLVVVDGALLAGAVVAIVLPV